MNKAPIERPNIEAYILTQILKMRKKYPNDADLGKEVRKFLNEIYIL